MQRTIPPEIAKKLLQIKISDKAREMLEAVMQQNEEDAVTKDLFKIREKIVNSQTMEMPQCFFEYLDEILEELKKHILTESTRSPA